MWKRILLLIQIWLSPGQGALNVKGRALEILSVCGIDDDEGEVEVEVAGAFDVLDAWGNRIGTW